MSFRLTTVAMLIAFSATTFAARADETVTVGGAQANVGFFDNVSDTRRRGIELELAQEIGQFGWKLDYSLIDATFRDTFMEFGKLNATVLGISGDYVFSHHEWAKHHKLPFPLLSDHDHRVARAYDSYMEQYGMNKRTIYLIDKEGVVRYVNPAFKAGDKKDYDTLRAELEKLK